MPTPAVLTLLHAPRVTLRPATMIEPGDLLIDPALTSPTRILWRHTCHDGVTFLLDASPPTTLRYPTSAHLPVVCRDGLARKDRATERATRIRCAARGAAWMRATGHPNQPSWQITTMLMVALAQLSGSTVEHAWDAATATL